MFFQLIRKDGFNVWTIPDLLWNFKRKTIDTFIKIANTAEERLQITLPLYDKLFSFEKKRQIEIHFNVQIRPLN